MHSRFTFSSPLKTPMRVGANPLEILSINALHGGREVFVEKKLKNLCWLKQHLDKHYPDFFKQNAVKLKCPKIRTKSAHDTDMNSIFIFDCFQIRFDLFWPSFQWLKLSQNSNKLRGNYDLGRLWNFTTVHMAYFHFNGAFLWKFQVVSLP